MNQTLKYTLIGLGVLGLGLTALYFITKKPNEEILPSGDVKMNRVINFKRA